MVGLSVTHEDGRSDIEAGSGDNGGDDDEEEEADEEETVRNRRKDRKENQETRASKENSENNIESQASQEKMIKCESFAEKLPTCYRSSLRQARFVKREKYGGNVEVF